MNFLSYQARPDQRDDVQRCAAGLLQLPYRPGQTVFRGAWRGAPVELRVYQPKRRRVGTASLKQEVRVPVATRGFVAFLGYRGRAIGGTELALPPGLGPSKLEAYPIDVARRLFTGEILAKLEAIATASVGGIYHFELNGGALLRRGAAGRSTRGAWSSARCFGTVSALLGTGLARPSSRARSTGPTSLGASA